MAASLKDISIITGFSVSTISKALNNKDDISTKTKEIIQKAALENNYQPNHYAVMLRKVE